jgi:tRNA(fMet)-specific endonuclease VapC
MLKKESMNILKHAKNSSRTSIMISDISVAELWHGVWKSEKITENEAKLNVFLDTFEKLPFDSSHGKTYGMLKSDQQKSGKSTGAYDLLIAAQALCMDAILVTANEKEFKQIKDLRIENWLR